ncbi:MAG: molybdate ABC transporter substrate-binding protein [Rhizobacter sp.]
MSCDSLHLLCAGAAKGLVGALQTRFTQETGAQLRPRFGAVGAMKEALQAGEPCDVLVVTAALIDTLAATGAVRGDTRAELGRVGTGLAVREGSPLPAVHDAAALREALLAADALYFPDPERATAGIHFFGVLHKLGIAEETAPRWRTYPNGATAMHELSAVGTRRSLGCTQITEIRYAEGVVLVGALPPGFELTTVYAAALTRDCARPVLAARFIELLSGPGSRAMRAAGGFEIGP